MSLTKVSYSMITGAIVNALDYGVLGNSSDCTAQIQAAIDATPDGGVLYFPNPTTDYRFSTRLVINKSITILGDGQYTTRLIAVGCSGFIVTGNTFYVAFKNIEIGASVRHTTTPNTYIGIEVSGTSVTHPSGHQYNNIFIDGFAYAFKSYFLWSTVFDNFRCGSCKTGIWAIGLSVNNVLTNSSLSGDSTDYGLYLDGSTDPSEGWMISNNLFAGFLASIVGVAVANVIVTGNIFDFNDTAGIIVSDNGIGNMGGNWTISNNYFGMIGSAGTAAIYLRNTVANIQNRGNIIIGNEIVVYQGASACLYGVYAQGVNATNNTIVGNTIKGFTNADIVGSVSDTITGNQCTSASPSIANITGGAVVSNNIGTVYYQRAVNYTTVGMLKITYDQDVPTTGTWARGDWCMNTAATSGGTPGWVCTTAGTPGTWKAMANLA